jgi:hypothetical protein
VADLYLSSIWEAWLRNFERGKTAAKLRRDMSRTRTPVDLIHDAFRTSGGAYFNGCDVTDPLAAAGLNWPDVFATCEEDYDDWLQLPVANAQALIIALEARPPSRAQFVRHLLEIGYGHSGPVQQFVNDLLADTGRPSAQTPRNFSPKEVDQLLATTTKRREELLGLLHKSVELNEPCSSADDEDLRRVSTPTCRRCPAVPDAPSPRRLLLCRS